MIRVCLALISVVVCADVTTRKDCFDMFKEGRIDGECVFKAGGGDEGDACAGALEHGVGANGGAVADDRCRLRADFCEGLENSVAWMAWRGEELEDDELSVAQGDAVSEGAAGVDGDALRKSLSWR